jgi:hypothetical protein
MSDNRMTEEESDCVLGAPVGGIANDNGDGAIFEAENDKAAGVVCEPANDVETAPSFVSPTVDDIKRRLASATATDGGWDRGGKETLMFEHPVANRTVLGSVEIDTSTDVRDARLELFAPPAVIAEVVRFIQAMEIKDWEPEVVDDEEEQVEEHVVVLPPTKEPTPEDLLEEAEGLPEEVLATDPDQDQVEV